MNPTIQKIAQLTGHNAAVFALAPGARPSEFLSAAGDGWIVRWDLDDPETGRLAARVETKIFSLFHLADRGVVVAGNMDGGVHWVDLASPERNRNVAHHRRGVFGICRVDEQVVTVGGDGLLTRWSADEFRTLESLQLSNQSLRSVDYSPERGELAVGASDNGIYLLDAATFRIRRHIVQAHDNSVFVCRYAPGGRRLLSGGRDAHLKIWDLEDDCALLSSQPAHWFTVNDIAFQSGGPLFATASRDKTIKIWSAESFELVKVLEGVRDGGHFNSVNRLFWSEHQGRLVSASDDRSMIVWEVREVNGS